ncbi:MAG: type II toxin-antitoxin system HicA family toxin [Rhodanobacteraceae bacterium]
MKLRRDVDAADLIKALSKLGYRVIRQTGSHIRLQSDDPQHSLTVPNHRPLRVGTLASILADVAIHQRLEKDALAEKLWP